MKRGMDRRHAVLACVSMLLLLIMASLCLGDVMMPETGKKTKKNGDMTIDYSHIDQGYVMIKSKKGNKKLKVRIKKGDTTLNYDLNNSGEYEVFPLQLGSGKYSFSLYKNVSGKKYSEEGKISLDAKLVDENQCFLYPNQYVNYTAATAAVVEAGKICDGMTDHKQIFDTVSQYMTSHFTYDYIKSVSVKSGQLPEIDDAWKKHMGICQDLSAIMVAMLRSQGVPARLMIGTVGASTYHAWVTAVINGDDVFFDPTAALNAINKNDSYTIERFY